MNVPPGASARCVQEIWLHPGTAYADRAGVGGSRLILECDDGRGTGLTIRSKQIVSDRNLEWVDLPLALPAFTPDGQRWQIEGVELFYDTPDRRSDQTLIWQVRLARLTGPNRAAVVYDEAARLASPVPASHMSRVHGVPVDGAFVLALRITVGDPADQIRIGAVRVVLGTPGKQGAGARGR